MLSCIWKSCSFGVRWRLYYIMLFTDASCVRKWCKHVCLHYLIEIYLIHVSSLHNFAFKSNFSTLVCYAFFHTVRASSTSLSSTCKCAGWSKHDCSVYSLSVYLFSKVRNFVFDKCVIFTHICYFSVSYGIYQKQRKCKCGFMKAYIFCMLACLLEFFYVYFIHCMSLSWCKPVINAASGQKVVFKKPCQCLS